MIVADFWAEGRAQFRDGKRQVTIRRFGWSDRSIEDAQGNADARAHDALARVLAGEPLTRRELKRSYNSGDGVPIREEVLSRHGEAVITRNLYGARCLNTPDVLFVDIDHALDPIPHPLLTSGWLVLLLLTAAGAWWLYSWWSLALIVLMLGAGSRLLGSVLPASVPNREAVEAHSLQRIRQFSASRPDWGLRVYATPAGLRVLVTHQRFRPDDIAVAECFDALQADPLYQQLCRNQRCFRARLSAKPWRIGGGSLRLSGMGVWPIRPERLHERQHWVTRYEQLAAGFAACRLLQSLGVATVDAAILPTLQLHDTQSRALESLPLA